MNNQPMQDNIFLVGFSGTGKSSVGRELARTLGYAYVDTDAVIEEATGRSIPDIFAQDGEAAFRKIERDVLWDVCHQDTQVVATGGGVVIDPDNRTHMQSSGYIVALEARIETIYTRMLLDTAKGEAAGRPLLAGGSGTMLARITELKRARAPFYAEADWTVHTDFLAPHEVADEIARAMPLIRRRVEGVRGGTGSGAPRSRAGERRVSVATIMRETGIRIPPIPVPPVETEPLMVKAENGTYPVIVEPGALARLGDYLKSRLDDAADTATLPRLFLITDVALTHTPHIERATASLTAAGFAAPVVLTVPGGESSKSLRMAEILYTQLAAQRAERRDIIIALGGGVTGDLGGFVAATFLRGMRLVQVPTTLLAMVDSSIGGKTGVNLGAIKNFVGAIYSPILVLADPDLLTTLPLPSFFEGFGEVIKHGVIPGVALPGESQQALADRAAARFAHLEHLFRNVPAADSATTAQAYLEKWGRTSFAAIVRESAAVKVGVVSQDEREGGSGLRMTLNFGHTLGHAIESAFNSAGEGSPALPLLHGEAVSLGMMAADSIALRRGLCDHAFVERHRTLLRAAHLPTTLAEAPYAAPLLSQGLDVLKAHVVSALTLDKKNEAGKVRWILPRGIGQIVIAKDVTPAEVAAAMADVGL